MATLDQVLNFKNLTKLAVAVKNGLPRVLPEAFYRVGPSKTIGDTGEYLKVEGTQQTARAVHYGGASKARELKGVSKQPFKCIHTFEHEHHNVGTLEALRNFDDAGVQDMGKAEIARQVEVFAKYFTNLQDAAVHSLLGLGSVYFDGDGDLLHSSSGAQITVDPGIPAAHKSQLAVFGTDLITADWSTAGTKIVSDVQNVKAAAIKETGYPLKYAFYGKDILSDLLGNTQCAVYIAANPGFAASFAAGEIPPNFLGLTWLPAYGASFKDADGTFRDWWGATYVTFTPEPSPDWWEIIPGSFSVPSGLTIAKDANAAAASFTKVFGIGSFAEITTDPPGIKHYMFDTFYPCLKVPKAIYIADTS